MFEVQELTAGYSNLIVLREISFSIKTREVLAVIGANGAGKSTLLWALSGLIFPKSGRVVIEGRNIAGWDSTRILRVGISHVSQGMQVFGELTVEDNLILATYGHKSQVKRQKARNLSQVYNYFRVLYEKRTLLAKSLSGGEKQMLAIARALMCEPKLLLLDEPSAGLAPLLVKHLFELLNELREKLSLTTLLIEQNAEVALRFANRAIVLAQGKIMLEGEAQSLINNEEVKEIYLGKGSIRS